MKRLLRFCLVLGFGMVMGRWFESIPLTAAAGGGQGGGIETCASKNGDANADGNVDLSDAVTILGNLFLGNPVALPPLCSTQVPSAGLPDTGQKSCYDTTHELVDCGIAFCSGQDGFYATGCPSEGRFVDNGDGTVADRCTGLMWQKTTADANGDGQSTVDDFVPWCAALRYCEDLSFAGHDDWRLPNVRELQSIIDYGRFEPSFDPVFVAFSEPYWSSTTSAGLAALAWIVFFENGQVVITTKGSTHYFRAVRSGR